MLLTPLLLRRRLREDIRVIRRMIRRRHTSGGRVSFFLQAPLVKGSDGSFYGTTQYGGPGGAGTVFQMTPAGVLKTLVAFGGRPKSS